MSQSHRPDLVNSHEDETRKQYQTCPSRNPTVLIWSIPTKPNGKPYENTARVAIPPS